MAVNMAGELTPIQTRAVIALMEERTITEAAAKADVGERTLYRWMKDPFFKLALAEAESQMMGSATRRLCRGTDDALDTLIELMNDPAMSPGVRLSAARTWLEWHYRFRSRSDEFELRVTQLEAQYHGKNS